METDDIFWPDLLGLAAIDFDLEATGARVDVLDAGGTSLVEYEPIHT